MADDYSWLIPLIQTGAKYLNSTTAADSANADMLGAYEQMLANLRERFGDYDKLGSAGYKDIVAEQMGPSAFEGIAPDLEARQAQQESMAALADLAANGGLSLADMQALNEIQRNLSRNDSARRQGLANEFAARGQLGSGAQLAMALQGQQQAAESASQRGESAAAQAQQRAMQAILQRGQMARGMGNDDYARKADAARARDAIEARNAAARTDASKYNNSLRGQAFEDELSKARGKTALTDSLNKTVFNKAGQSANTKLGTASMGNSLLDGLGNLGGGGTQGNTTTSDSNFHASRGSPSDISEDDDK